MKENQEYLTQQRLEQAIRKVTRKLEDVEDIFSLKAQKEFINYKGDVKQYMRERDLRIKASGRKRTFFNIAAALTGSSVISKIISDKFDQKYSEADVEEAKKALSEEFGVKEKEKEEKKQEQTTDELFAKHLDPITKSVAGLVAAADKTSAEISRIYSSLSTLHNSTTGVISDLVSAVMGKSDSSGMTGERLKPMTITGLEGEDYLYYPDAPEGRKLYEKSAKGTAGRIASRETQRALKDRIEEAMRSRSTAPVRVTAAYNDSNNIVEEIRDLLKKDSAYRKVEMQSLISELKTSMNVDKRESIFDVEEDEKQDTLKKALHKALEQILEENPDLLKCESDGLGMLFNPFGKGKMPRAPGGLLTRVLPLLRFLGFATAAVGVTAAIGYALDQGFSGAGDDAIQKLAKGSASDIAVALERGYNKEYTRQRLHEMAQSDPGLALKLEQAEKMAGLKPTSNKSGNTLVMENKNQPVGNQIIDENRKKVQITNADQVTIPSQTVNQYNSTSVIPIPSTERDITVNNPENTLNRLLNQDFNPTTTYWG